MNLKSKIKKINSLLVKHFGIPKRSKTLPDPVDLLIATILSQNTNDKNSYKAYKNLKSKYPKWESLASLSLKRIEKLIAVAGLSKQKSAAIKGLLKSLVKEQGRISLNYLKRKSDDQIINELIKFKGFGLKTASCVLLFAMDRNVCPVDTHVHRTLNRIGIVKSSTPDKTFLFIKESIPEGTAHQFHTNLIRLGREVCKSAKPNCNLCPVEKVCEFEDKNFGDNKSYKQNKFMLLDEV